MFSSNKYKNVSIFFLIVISVTLADQWTKNWAFEWLMAEGEFVEGYRVIPIIEDCFSFKEAYNPGVAWSFLRDYPFELTILTTLISIALCFYALYSSTTKWVLLSWAFVVGGALGNIVDRFDGVIKGYSAGKELDTSRIHVRDFLDVYWGAHHWPTFNLADSMICIGVAYLFFYSFFIEGKEQKDEKAQAASVEEQSPDGKTLPSE